VFAGRDNVVSEYHPVKQTLRSVVRYEKGETIVWMSCTPSNSLMVMRYNQSNCCLIEVYSLE
jgi:hypothetical protein